MTPRAEIVWAGVRPAGTVSPLLVRCHPCWYGVTPRAEIVWAGVRTAGAVLNKFRLTSLISLLLFSLHLYFRWRRWWGRFRRWWRWMVRLICSLLRFIVFLWNEIKSELYWLCNDHNIGFDLFYRQERCGCLLVNAMFFNLAISPRGLILTTLVIH